MHTAVVRYDGVHCHHCHKLIQRNSLKYINNNHTYCCTAHARAAQHNQQTINQAMSQHERLLDREGRRQSRLDAAYRDHM